jgi:hypothetical protein
MFCPKEKKKEKQVLSSLFLDREKGRGEREVAC